MCWHNYSKWKYTGVKDYFYYPVQVKVCRKCCKMKLRSIKGSSGILMEYSQVFTAILEGELDEHK